MQGFFQRLDLPADVRRTFRYHLAYALLDAATGGILLNAPTFALKAIQGQNWHLPIRDLYAGLGMLVALYLGSWMAPRRKMPFVVVPGLLAGSCSLAMALAVDDAFWLLTLLGLGAMFEITTRPATAAILRLNYPVAQRGQATGIVRRWSSCSFLVVILLSAYSLDGAGDRVRVVARVQFAVAALTGLAAFLCFRRIRVADDSAAVRRDLRPEILKNVRDAVAVVVRDGRYRRYVLACFVDGFCGMLYFPLILACFQRLGFGYVGCAAMVHAVPALMAFATTGAIGRWIDRSNPWVSWAWIRFAWGLDALLLAAIPLAAPLAPPMALILPVLGRIIRGSVQGGQWVLWWQIGVTYFAPPGGDTSRYMGIMVFLNGATKFLASAAAIALTAMSVRPETLLALGGLGVIASGAYSLWQAFRERKQRLPGTIAQFEAQFVPEKR
jgi:hypothetical protein